LKKVIEEEEEEDYHRRTVAIDSREHTIFSLGHGPAAQAVVSS
jgi:hypothetical protein